MSELKACFCMSCMRHSDSFTDRDLDFLKDKTRLPKRTGLDEFFWSGK